MTELCLVKVGMGVQRFLYTTKLCTAVPTKPLTPKFIELARRNNRGGTGELAQPVKCLPRKYEDTSSSLLFSFGLSAHVNRRCQPWEHETRVSQRLLSALMASQGGHPEEPLLKSSPPNPLLLITQSSQARHHKVRHTTFGVH